MIKLYILITDLLNNNFLLNKKILIKSLLQTINKSIISKILQN